jgi:hypothetical protein
VPSFSSGEVLCRRARVQSQVERSEPKGNLDGFLARLHHSPQNEGKETEPISELGVKIAVNIICLGGGSAGIVIAMKKNVGRAVIEVGFIIFLFYSNLLMGEFERSGLGQKKGLAWAIADVFTSANFEIAAVAALVGYVVFEFLRKRF